MGNLIFKMGEAEIGSENTDIGILPAIIKNGSISQTNILTFRPSTEVLYSEQSFEEVNGTFWISEPRNWTLLLLETNNSSTIKIVDLATKTVLQTFDMAGVRNTIIPEIQYAEYTASELPSFTLAANRYKGISGIFICGFDKLYYIDDDLILKPFIASTASGEIPLAYPADIEIFQRRLYITTSTAGVTFQQRNSRTTVIGTQHVLGSVLDQFDQFTITTPISDTLNGIDLRFYLEPYEWLYTMKGVLDALYLTSNAGFRQMRSVDRTQDAITTSTAMQEIIGYGEGIATKVQFFSGALIYATKKGLRYKLPSATFSVASEDIAESALPIFTTFDDEIKELSYTKKDQKLLILLKSGKVKAISEGVPTQAGLKTFPVTSYIDTEDYKVLSICQQTRTYFLIRDVLGFIHILRESNRIIPLADGVAAVKLTSTVTSSTSDTITFPEESLIVLNNTNSLWVRNAALNYWINIFQVTNLGNVYKKNSDAGSLAGMASAAVEYFPITDDIRPYLPTALQEHALRSVTYSRFPDPDYPGDLPGADPNAWYSKGLEITISGKNPSGKITGRGLPAKTNQLNSGLYVFSGFFELSSLKDTSAVKIATSAASYYQYSKKHHDTREINFGWCLGTAIDTLKASHIYGGGSACSYYRHERSFPDNNIREYYTQLAYKSTTTEKQIPDNKDLVWIYSVFTLNTSNASSPSLDQAGLWINGEKHEVTYGTASYSAPLLNPQKTTVASSVILSSDNSYDGLLRKIYCSSLFLHCNSTRNLSFDIFDIEQARQYFCTADSLSGYYRPKFIPEKASLMHFQDQYNGLKNIATDEIFKVSGTGFSIRTVDLKQILPEGADGFQ
jgi:hypothetical protein